MCDGRTELDDERQILFDPATGRAVGSRSVYSGDAEPIPADG